MGVEPVQVGGECHSGDRRVSTASRWLGHTCTMARLPMFPLGSVLFPGAVLPLQVFEPRYRSLVEDIGEIDNRFGVVLIERGSEVGGGDVRSSVGTVAEVVRRGEAEDGRTLITAVGRERIRVTEWYDDDPYPIAAAELYSEVTPGPDVEVALGRCLQARRRLLALAIEMGATGQTLDLDVPVDRVNATWALCAAAPVGSFDRQRLLEIENAADRLVELERMLVSQIADLETALRGR